MDSKKIFSAICAVNLMVTLLATNSYAEPQNQPQQQPPCEHRKPPQPAIDACNGKKAGDLVSFIGRYKEKVNGTCAQMDDVLAARPEGSPPHDEKGAH
jgi:hypothetical protein